MCTVGLFFIYSTLINNVKLLILLFGCQVSFTFLHLLSVGELRHLMERVSLTTPLEVIMPQSSLMDKYQSLQLYWIKVRGQHSA